MVEEGLKHAKRLLLLIGSSHAPASRKNPWSYDERLQLIQSALSPEIMSRLIFAPLRDCPNDDEVWKQQVLDITQTLILPQESFALMGHQKDESSYYLRLFPEWPYLEFPSMGAISATPIREAYFQTPITKRFDHPHLAPLVLTYLNQFRQTSTFQTLQQSP